MVQPVQISKKFPFFENENIEESAEVRKQQSASKKALVQGIKTTGEIQITGIQEECGSLNQISECFSLIVFGEYIIMLGVIRASLDKIERGETQVQEDIHYLWVFQEAPHGGKLILRIQIHDKNYAIWETRTQKGIYLVSLGMDLVREHALEAKRKGVPAPTPEKTVPVVCLKMWEINALINQSNIPIYIYIYIGYKSIQELQMEVQVDKLNPRLIIPDRNISFQSLYACAVSKDLTLIVLSHDEGTLTIVKVPYIYIYIYIL